MTLNQKIKLKSGHEVSHVTGEELEELKKEFTANHHGIVRLLPEGYFLFSTFVKYADKLYNFKFKPSDVVIMTYPKCGSTWMQNIVWTMQRNRKLDNPDAGDDISLRCPFIEMDYHCEINVHGKLPEVDPEFLRYFNNYCAGKRQEDGILLQIAQDTPDPRSLKTHLPFSMLSPDLLETCKVIYVARNPKDVCVSYHHHHRLLALHGYSGDWDSFIDYFINDNVLHSPYWSHVKQAWEKRNHPNLLICFYEEMNKNPRENIERINDFIKTGLTEEEMNKVVQHTSFASLKSKELQNAESETCGLESFANVDIFKSEGGFFRKGQSGDWRSKFTKEQAERIDRWAKKNVSEFGPEFPYYNSF